jgi:hypothetical protein
MVVSQSSASLPAPFLCIHGILKLCPCPLPESCSSLFLPFQTSLSLSLLFLRAPSAPCFPRSLCQSEFCLCEEVSSGDPSVHMSTHHCDPSRLSSRKDTDFRPDSSCYLTIFIRLCQYPVRGNAPSGKATCKAPRVMTSLRESSAHGRVPVT